MNRQEFSEILINPHSLKTDQIKKINLILNTFPYFQSARAIYLKGLKSNNSFKYNQALKTTAAYTTNRNVLFDFITSDSFNQNDISQQIKESHCFVFHGVHEAHTINKIRTRIFVCSIKIFKILWRYCHISIQYHQ